VDLKHAAHRLSQVPALASILCRGSRIEALQFFQYALSGPLMRHRVFFNAQYRHDHDLFSNFNPS
jgi:hypothetical protein